jgi:hypothetical protein
MYFQKLANQINVQPILDALDANPQLWNQNPIRTTHVENDYGLKSPHLEVDDILIRFNRMDQSLEQAVVATDCYWYPASDLIPVDQIIYQLMPAVRADQIGRVMITKMAPGAFIAPHEDQGPPAEYYQRFHLCLQNEPGAQFICGDEVMEPLPGDLFWVNNAATHSVRNDSMVDRLTLIIDLRTTFNEHLKPCMNLFRDLTKQLPPETRSHREIAIQESVKRTDYPSGTSFQVERWNDVIAEMLEYEVAHWDELGLDHQDVPQDIDFARYRDVDNAGKLHVVTARLDGKVIGYHISLINSHLHYKSTLHATVDLYYLDPVHRKSKIGVEMFLFAEKSLTDLGVVKVITGTKIHLNHSQLFESLGYKGTELVFTKILRKPVLPKETKKKPSKKEAAVFKKQRLNGVGKK